MESHLLQMRGLKQEEWVITSVTDVASFTDAWIETTADPINFTWIKVASFTDAWIETHSRSKRLLLRSRIFYRCVD